MSRIEVHLPRDGHDARLDTGREGMAESGFVGHGSERIRNGLEGEWRGWSLEDIRAMNERNATNVDAVGMLRPPWFF